MITFTNHIAGIPDDFIANRCRYGRNGVDNDVVVVILACVVIHTMCDIDMGSRDKEVCSFFLLEWPSSSQMRLPLCLD